MTAVHRFETVGSTNDVAYDLFERGEPPPFWVVADRQLGGRGRRGRSWVSEPGNLYVTLLIAKPRRTDRLPTLSLAAAVGVRSAIDRLGRFGPRLALKWPNDLLLDSRKVAGILLEARGKDAIMVGCGVNCAQHPSATSYGATDLNAAGLVTSPTALFVTLKEEVRSALHEWNEGEGFEQTRSAWLANATGLGSPASVTVGTETIRGVARTIDHEGRLIMDVDGEEIAVSAGDLVLGGPA